MFILCVYVLIVYSHLMKHYIYIRETQPNERLGAKGAQEVKSHQFFTEVNWDALY